MNLMLKGEMLIMIIDSHTHFWSEEMIGDDISGFFNVISEHRNLDREKFVDTSLSRLIQDMNEASIDKSVLLPIDFKFIFSTEQTIKEYNDLAADYFKRAPKRIIPFAGIDPRRGKEAVEEIRRCADMGFKGVKLWPQAGFAPDNKEFYHLYQTVSDLGLVVLIHTGFGPRMTYAKYCRPILIDNIAVDFPDITFIAAHAGPPWIDEALNVSEKNPNVYIDIAAWQLAYYKAPMALVQLLAKIKTIHGNFNKLLFGSDGPFIREICSQKKWVQIIKDIENFPVLNKNKKMNFVKKKLMKEMIGLKITYEDKQKILGLNAKRIFNL